MKKNLLMTVPLFIAAFICIGVAVAYGFDLSERDGEDTPAHGGIAEVVQNEYVRVKTDSSSTSYTKDSGAISIMPAYYTDDGLVPSFAVASPSECSSSELLFWDSGKVTGAIDRIVTVKNEGKSAAYVRTVFLMPVVLEFNLSQGDWSLTVSDDTVCMDGGEYRLMVALYRANGGKLPPGVESAPNLLQVLLSMETTPDELEKYLDGQGKLKLYIVSQAVQSEGLGDDAEGALDKTFGQISADNNPWT